MTIRKAAIALVCAVPLAVAAASDPKPVATITLPCETKYQLFSPAGNQVAVDCKDESLLLVDVATGAVQRTLGGKNVGGADFSRDGLWFALRLKDSTVQLFSTADSSPPRTFQIPAHARILEFRDLGHMIVRPEDGPGQIWDLRNTPRQVATLHNDFGRPTDAAFSPDGKLLVMADGDTVIRYYDTSNWKLVHEYRGLLLESFSVVFTPDGKHVLAGGAEDHITELDLSGNEERRLPIDTGVPGTIYPFGTSGQALVEYFDGEGRAPGHAAFLELATGKSTALSGPTPATIRQVKGQLWIATLKDKSLIVSKYE